MNNIEKTIKSGSEMFKTIDEVRQWANFSSALFITIHGTECIQKIQKYVYMPAMLCFKSEHTKNKTKSNHAENNKKH